MTAPLLVSKFGANSATFSADLRHRYLLYRELGAIRTVVWCMLNPSIANEEEDDPTIRRCIGYTQSWGYGRTIVVNAYAYRSTSPAIMYALERNGYDIVGPWNEDAIKIAAQEARDFDGIFVAAWGSGKDKQSRESLARRAIRIRALIDDDIYCLKTNKDGMPVHPLYQPADIVPQLWRKAA